MAPPRLKLAHRDATADDAEPEMARLCEPNADRREVATLPAGDEPVSPSRSATPANLPAESVRIVEALLFASAEPLGEDRLAAELPAGTDVTAILADLKAFYAPRGVNLVRTAGRWMFRTAQDLGYLMERHAVEPRRLSKAALETLAIIAYHQPVTRAEIEEIRGVATSKGTLDVLMEVGWVRPRGRRRAPGKPVTYGTSETFLAHFGLDTIKDLPGLSELKGAGLLDANLPPGFTVPEPTDIAALMPDELPLEDPDAGQEALAFEPPEDGVAVETGFCGATPGALRAGDREIEDGEPEA